MKTFFSITLLAVISSIAGYSTPLPLANTGITAGTGCIGTVALPEGCLLAGHAGTQIQGWTIFTAPSGSSLSPVAITQDGGSPVNTTNPWAADNATSTWLRPANGTSPFNGVDSDPLGAYQWRYSFTLTPAEAIEANKFGLITGRYLSDDVGFFTFNGVQVAANGAGINQNFPDAMTFQTWTPFTINSGFQTGLNIIQVNVENVSTGFAEAKVASGLRVEFMQAAILPEGGEIAGLVLGLGAVLLVWNRKRADSAGAR